MRILHVVRQFYPCVGGIENFVECLAKEQKRFGNEVSILTLNKNFATGQALNKQETYAGIPIKRIPFIGIKRYPVALSCIKYLGDYDIIHIHCIDFFVDYLVLTKFIHKKKLIVHTHGGFFHTPWLMWFKKIYFYLVTRLILLGCDKIIVDSIHDYKLFGQISKKIVLIDDGVDTNKFNNIDKRVAPWSLLFVGRLDVNKRIDNLLLTVALLKEKNKSIKLRIAGSDWAGIKHQLDKLIDKLNIKDNVAFLGKITEKELVEEFSKAHIFVSASQYESFGISAVEALASGTPCVLNDIESFKSFLNGYNCGMLTDFNNHKGSAENIFEILALKDDQYRILSFNARKRGAKFSWDIVAKKITKEYY